MRDADKLHWSIDSLVIRDGACFGFGWIFHIDQEIVEVRLAHKSDPQQSGIGATLRCVRDDVAARFNDAFRSKHCGFVLFGATDPNRGELDAMRLRGVLADGSNFDLMIPDSKIARLDTDDPSQLRRMKLLRFWAFAQRGIRLFFSGKFALLREKAGRHLARASMTTAPSAKHLGAVLSRAGADRIILILDHDLGGGANQYRQALVEQRTRAGDTVLVLSYHLASLSFMLSIRSRSIDQRLRIAGYDFIREIAESIGFAEIIYNTGVSFVHPEQIPPLLSDLRKVSKASLTILIHDFFVVCPSHFLLNAQGQFCGLPDAEICRSCLAKNPHGFTTLYPDRDILRWREIWGSMLIQADNIVLFSDESLALLHQAYPSLGSAKVTVKPHKVDYLPSGPVAPTFTDTLKIGVVGHIGHHKGAQLVRELASEITRRELNIEIVVIGSIDANYEKGVISETGPYRHEELPDLIRDAEVNVMLFPSIWPETFSYVVQELIQLNLPVACLDMGAPAGRIAAYSNGLILRNTDPPSILNELMAFHRRLYCRGLSHEL
jgi:glycosyltransferase involved in cell wall biosynthesis